MEHSNLSLSLPEAPGAKAARVCGILAIICACTCLCFPVGLVLGIVALVQHSKAKQLATNFPSDYRPTLSSGFVLGIIGLVLSVLALPGTGIVSAIAIPALLGQRTRARDKASEGNLRSQIGTLTEKYDQAKEKGLSPVAIQAEMEQFLSSNHDRNPWNMQTPAFRYTIPVVSAASSDDAKLQAETQARTEGEVVFVISFPQDPKDHGYLAGAVRLKTATSEAPVVSQVVELD